MTILFDRFDPLRSTAQPFPHMTEEMCAWINFSSMVLLSIHAKVAVLKYAGHRVIDRVMLACIAAFGFVITHPSFRCIFFLIVFLNRLFQPALSETFNDTIQWHKYYKNYWNLGFLRLGEVSRGKETLINVSRQSLFS